MLSIITEIFTLQNLLMMNVGLFVGVIIGAMPGLNVALAVTVLLTLSIGMESLPGMFMLLGGYCGAMYGGSITAILINTPGTPNAAATSLDGYPMAKKGRAGDALKPRAHARPMRQHHDIRLRARPWRGGRDKHPAGQPRRRAAAASHWKRAFMGAGGGSLPHHGPGGRCGIRMHRVGGIRRLRRAAHGHTVRGAGHARAPFVVLQAAACAHR